MTRSRFFTPCNYICIPTLTDNYIWVLRDHLTPFTAVVDPACASAVIEILDRCKWKLDAILNTHHHYDHVGGNLDLIDLYHPIVYGSSKDRNRIPGITHYLHHGDEIKLGCFDFYIIELDGHTIGHIGYYDRCNHWLFVGDTLFSLGCGRLFEGSAEMMYRSLTKLATLTSSSNPLVFCAHEYTVDNGLFVQSLNWKSQQVGSFVNYARHLRSQKLPTIPTRLSIEQSLNPFLNTDDPILSQSIAKKLNTDESFNGDKLLKKLRALKESLQYRNLQHT